MLNLFDKMEVLKNAAAVDFQRVEILRGYNYPANGLCPMHVYEHTGRLAAKAPTFDTSLSTYACLPERDKSDINRQMELAVYKVPLPVEKLDRDPEEDEWSWYLFRSWLTMGINAHGGPMARRWEDLYARGPGWDVATLQALAERFQWRERVQIYDSLLARRCLELTQEALEDMKGRQIALGLSMQSVGGAEMQKWYHKAINSGDMPVLPPAVAVRMIDAGVKMERLVRGETTEIIGESKPDLSALTDDELETYRNLLAKTGMK